MLLNTVLAFGTLIGKTQLFPVPALEKIGLPLEGALERYPEICDRPKKVRSNPPSKQGPLNGGVSNGGGGSRSGLVLPFFVLFFVFFGVFPIFLGFS